MLRMLTDKLHAWNCVQSTVVHVFSMKQTEGSTSVGEEIDSTLNAYFSSIPSQVRRIKFNSFCLLLFLGTPSDGFDKSTCYRYCKLALYRLSNTIDIPLITLT